MSTDGLLPTEHAAFPMDLDVQPAAHLTTRYDGAPTTTLEDYQEFLTPPDGIAEILLLLEELGQLCLLVSKRRLSNLSVPLEFPYLEKYRSWIIAQARNVVVSLASTHRSLDNETILARIEVVVSQLVLTSAAPVARIIHQICRNMGDLLSGRALDDILSESLIEDEATTTFASLEWRTLETHDDSDDQGFDCHRYDLIVASNTLRTSANVQCLGHLKKLLRHDGHLIVQDLDSLAHWVTYVFGLQRKWWSREEHEGLDEHPSQDLNGWKRRVAAVCLARVSSNAVDGKREDLLTLTLVKSDSLLRRMPENVTGRRTKTVCDNPASMITEKIIRHLKEDGYRVTKCQLESQALTGQDIISVESVDSGCATVAVVYNQHRQ